MEAEKGISQKLLFRFLTKGLRIPSGAEPRQHDKISAAEVFLAAAAKE